MKKRRLIALILCICLISSFCMQPVAAMGAEGAIIGGAAGAAGITLSIPQVALLVALGFGLVYTVTHAEELAQGLENALNTAANNIDTRIEELNIWKEAAKTGMIALSSATPWIIDAIKGWVSGLYEGKDNSQSSISYLTYPANSAIPSVEFWGSNTVSFPVDTNVVRSGNIYTSSDGWLNFNAYMVAISTISFTGASSYTYREITYYYKAYSSFNTKSDPSKPFTEYEQLAYDCISQLLPLKDILSYGGTNFTAHVRAFADGYFGQQTGSICPDQTVGGIENVLGDHDIGAVNIPDMDIGDSQLFPKLADGSIDDNITSVIDRIMAQDLTWSQVMEDVLVGTPSISIPQADGIPLVFPITDVGIGDIPIDTTQPTTPPSAGQAPEGLAPYTIDLTDFFPFCIPFDIAEFVNILCAEPEAPKFDWTFKWYDGSTDSLTIDLAPFDSVAQLLRNMELLLFCIGLALITRNQIRG